MLYLILGASGSGKTTLSSCLRDMDINELKSHTTRSIRENEVPADQGGTYFFVTREEFEQIPMIEVTEYAGNLYGTSKDEISRVLSKKTPAYAIVDRNGAQAFKEAYGDMVKIIFVYAPAELLIERMRARGDSEDSINKRIIHALATGELNNLDISDYCLVNKDLDEAVRVLKGIIDAGDA